jgi:HD-GYP domain-containing protein (c-di-GMP phosphodiesterase class II)
MAVVHKRAGKVYDPQIAERFSQIGAALLNRLQSESVWDATLGAEPAPPRLLTTPEFDEVATRVANFVDMRSPYTVGHSVAVASLSEGTALELGLSANDALVLRQAGLLHDIGRAGIPVSVWNKSRPLAPDEWERMKRHPAFTEIVLARSSSLGHLGTLAGLHHEKLDGSGYRGLSAASLPITARILAAADTYRTRLEARPHRSALSPELAADDLRDQARHGKLDGEVIDALLTAAGQKPRPQKQPLPAGLSEREVEVLALAVRGLSNRQIADALFLAPKTIGHHLENIYSKTGVSTRVGATLFALQHGLISDPADR